MTGACAPCLAGARCPTCGKPGLRLSWKPEGDMEQLEYVCSDVECPRARKSWVVLVTLPSRSSQICPVCGEVYLRRFPNPEDKGLYIHEVQKDLEILRVTKGCFHGQSSDFTVGG